MHDFYKPSGKISPVFFVYLLLSLVFIIPIFSLLQAVVLRYSPVPVITLAGAVICLLSVALLCGHWCIAKGKVRNKKVAFISAFLTGLAFMYMSLIFYCAFFENRLRPVEIAAFFTTPTYLSGSVERVLEQGVAIASRYSLKIRGGLLIALWAVASLLTQIVVIISYLLTAGKPFIEKRGQWAKEIALEFGYIEDSTEFTEKMSVGDLDYIVRLPILQGTNVSHSAFKLYPMEDNYYLSAENKTAKAPDKNGQVKFDEETLFKYLSISKQAGDTLLAKQIHHDREQVSARIVSKSTKRREGFSLLKNVAVAGLFFFSLIQAFSFGQIGQSDSTAYTILFCSVVFVIYYALCALGSFAKEDVIVLEDTMFDEDWQPQDALTDLYRIERKDSGVFYKAFYLLMTVASTGFLAYMIYYIWM